jgi:hypothetical protein
MRAVKRILLGLLALVALFFGLRALVRALASDETKIRWLIEDMTEGFNETRMNPVLSGLAQDFLAQGRETDADKASVRAGLAQLFLQRKDAQTKRFPYRAQVPEADFEVHVEPGEPRSAAADFLVDCDESQGEEWRPTWKAKVHAELVLGPGGWKIRRASLETRDGRRPR